MLPKKRKFDLSKFELDRGEAGGAGTSHGLAPGPGGGSVTVTSVDRPGHQQRPPRRPVPWLGKTGRRPGGREAVRSPGEVRSMTHGKKDDILNNLNTAR